MLNLTRKELSVMLGASLFLSSAQLLANEHSQIELKAQAITIVKEFGGTLKPLLKNALQKGGVKEAVEVCSKKAPDIAEKLSLKTSWQVKRVSLKARNQQNAVPNSWETSVLKEFNQRQLNGESVIKMAKADIVNNEFRFMKAQGVEPLCLTCHGRNLSEETKEALAKHYPEDKATGYALGEVRGAFSLTKSL